LGPWQVGWRGAERASAGPGYGRVFPSFPYPVQLVRGGVSVRPNARWVPPPASVLARAGWTRRPGGRPGRSPPGLESRLAERLRRRARSPVHSIDPMRLVVSVKSVDSAAGRPGASVRAMAGGAAREGGRPGRPASDKGGRRLAALSSFPSVTVSLCRARGESPQGDGARPSISWGGY